MKLLILIFVVTCGCGITAENKLCYNYCKSLAPKGMKTLKPFMSPFRRYESSTYMHNSTSCACKYSVTKAFSLKERARYDGEE